MAEGSLQFLLDDAKWEVASRAARERSVRLYSTERIVPMYENFYEYVLEGS
jgi:glycosyltransferase involved in cell wall biosynthesis